MLEIIKPMDIEKRSFEIITELLGRTENAEELAGRILRQRLPLGEAGRAKP